MQQWLDDANWIWMAATMIAWVLLIAVVGCGAVLAAWRGSESV